MAQNNLGKLFIALDYDQYNQGSILCLDINGGTMISQKFKWILKISDFGRFNSLRYYSLSEYIVTGGFYKSSNMNSDTYLHFHILNTLGQVQYYKVYQFSTDPIKFASAKLSLVEYSESKNYIYGCYQNIEAGNEILGLVIQDTNDITNYYH